MPTGVSLQLFNGTTPQASLSGIQALWWDVTEPKDATRPVGKSNLVSTDATGFISLDLSGVTGLATGDSGFLMLYKLDATNHQDSLMFSGKVATSTVASGVDMYYHDEPIVDDWVRNPSWLALPDVTGLQKFAGLHRIDQDSNFCALQAAGAYTVNWGDGTVEDIATGVSAYHQYDFANVNLANTNAPVTLTDAGDLVTRTAHGHSNGTKVSLWNIVTTTGITEAASYYVVGATANTFQLAATLGGAAIALTGNGTATLLPYKQAIVTVVPQAGQNLTSFTLQIKHNQAGLYTGLSGLMDIAIAGANLTSLVISANSTSVTFPHLEQVSVIGPNGLTYFSGLLAYCKALRSVPVMSGALVTDWGAMFDSCASLQTISLDAPAGTNFAGMFAYCSALNNVTLSNTSMATSFNSMFTYCSSLTWAPRLDSASVTNFADMFAGCYAMETVPKMDTGAGNLFTNMFGMCYSMQSAPLLDTSLGLNFGYMFSGCNALQVAPALNTSQGTNFTRMFDSCYALEVAPQLDTAQGILFNYMFSNCTNMTRVPSLNTPAGLDFNGMFTSCHALTEVVLPNTGNGTNFSNMFSYCYALKVAPSLNTALGTIFSYMFTYCYALQLVPPMNTASGTNFNMMFNNCEALQVAPVLNLALATIVTNMFYGCFSLIDGAMINTKISFSYANLKLSGAGLNAIYTGLYGPVTGKTITVSGNWGTATDNPSIATAKGWTVSG